MTSTLLKTTFLKTLLSDIYFLKYISFLKNQLMDAPDKLTEWETRRDELLLEQHHHFLKLQDFKTIDAIETDKILLVMEETKTEINRAKGVIKRMKKKIEKDY